ncbi:hypothetical protein AB5I41_11725 [Sphingomonas sp. MMS24-JH45]
MASAVPRLKVREINVPEGRQADDDATAPWRLDIRARAPGRPDRQRARPGQ